MKLFCFLWLFFISNLSAYTVIDESKRKAELSLKNIIAKVLEYAPCYQSAIHAENGNRTATVSVIAYSPNNNKIAIGKKYAAPEIAKGMHEVKGGMVQEWSWDAGSGSYKKGKIICDVDSEITGLSYSPDGERLAVIFNKRFYIYDVTDEKIGKYEITAACKDEINKAYFIVNSRNFVVASETEIMVWDVLNNEKTVSEKYPFLVKGFALNYAEGYLHFLMNLGSVFAFCKTDSSPISENKFIPTYAFESVLYGAPGVKFFNNESVGFSFGSEGNNFIDNGIAVHLFKHRSSTDWFSLNGEDEIIDAAFSSDGLYIVLAYNNKVEVQKTDTGQRLLPPFYHKAKISALSVNPGKNFKAVGSALQDVKLCIATAASKTVSVWFYMGVKVPVLKQLPDFPEEIRTLTFSPDGKQLAIASGDKVYLYALEEIIGQR